MWSLPEYPVFVDGRTDLYNDEIISQWLQVVRTEDGWEDVLEQWDVRAVLLEPEMPLISKLEEHGWESVYVDQQAFIFVR